MGAKWSYRCYFIGCCFHSILVQLPSSFFSMHFVCIQVVQYSSIDTATTLKKSYFILSERSEFHMIDSPSIAVDTFARCMLISFSIDEILQLSYINWSIDYRGFATKSEDSFFLFKTHEFCFICIHIEANGSCCLL